MDARGLILNRVQDDGSWVRITGWDDWLPPLSRTLLLPPPVQTSSSGAFVTPSVDTHSDKGSGTP